MQNSSAYVLKNQPKFESNADTEEWEPSDEILKFVPNIRNVPVVLITEETDLNKANEVLRAARIVGLVVMGELVHRTEKPSLILLTTDHIIYAIQPDDYRRGIRFLKSKLQDREIEFWTTNGINESDCLFHHYKIDLTQEPNVNCCSGFHIYMMKVLHDCLEPTAIYYPGEAVKISRSKSPCIESFERLVQIWLGVDRSDIFFDDKKLAHLNSRPLDLTAVNIIKRRCSLVVPLAKWLEYFDVIEAMDMCSRAFSQFNHLPERLIEIVVTKRQNLKKERKLDPAILTHLDQAIFGN